jgi:hypothetical protein
MNKRNQILGIQTGKLYLMNRLFIGLLSAVMLSLGFSMPGHAEMLRHSNGLTLTAQSDTEVVRTESGFLIRESGSDRKRSPWSCEISFSIATIPGLDFPKSRRLANGRWRYRIDESEGGSGGQEWTFHATLPCKKGETRLRYSKQSEETPNFEQAWALADATQCPQ